LSHHFELELIVRMLLGGLLGGVIGYERDLHGRPAGLRTHAIVGLASSTFMVVSTSFVYFQHYAEHDLVGVDASRIAASVVSGIGFLAGGAILRTGITVQGLTTAAGLWLVAAIGLAAGGGMYGESIIATLAGVLVLTLLRRFEDKADDRVLKKLSVTCAKETEFALISEVLKELDVRLNEEDHERDLTSQRRTFHAVMSLPRALEASLVMDRLETIPGVHRLRVEPVR
jgi:putative Mg2+ transporter-C (MgtC) family protein